MTKGRHRWGTKPVGAVSGQGAAAGSVQLVEHLESREERPDRRDAAEGECLEQERRVAPQARVARLDELDRILAVTGGQGLGVADGGGEAVPPDRPLDGGEPVAAVGPGRDQPRAGLREQPQGPVDHPPIVAQGGKLPPLGPAEHPADELVVHVERLVGQAWPELEHRRHQDPAPARGRQAAQMAEREPFAFPREPDQMMTGHEALALGLEPDPADMSKALDGGVEGGGAGGSRWLTEPAEQRPGRVGADVEQLVEASALLTVETFGQPCEDRPLAAGEGGRAEPLDGRDPGHDDLAAPQLVAEADREFGAGPGGQAGLVEPALDLSAWPAFEGPPAEDVLQGRGVLVLGVGAEGVAAQGVRRDADLLGDERDHRVRELLARMQQAARVAERAELQGEAEPVATAATAVDRRQLGLAQRVMPCGFDPIDGQGEERRPLGRREDASTCHGDLSREGLAGLRSVDNIID